MTPFAALAALSLLGYHLTFDAEMSNQSDMSQFINTFANGDTRLYQNNEEENYVPYDPANPAQPYVFSNGALTLNATPVPSGGVPYTSGMIETAGIFAQSSGYFEMRASMPPAPGFWPAFWMLPAGAYYPEIDILEQPNNEGKENEYWTHIATATDDSSGFTDVGKNVFEGYHRYGFIWNANFIQFVFDGKLIGYPHDTPPSMVGLPMYFIANLAVGDPYSWPGAPPSGASSSLGIDYIRVFSNDPSVPQVSQEPISSPDGIDTTPVLMPPVPPTPPTLGSGPDTLVLLVSEDAYKGNAKFTISIDGKQHGGTQVAKAIHLVGQTQAFTLKGDFGGTPHTVTVDFLNDYSDNNGDRNLYVVGASINGTTIQNAVINAYGSGPYHFNFCGAPVPPVTIGSGPDSLVLGISQDSGGAGARYTISVDGVQQGGTQTASALHGNGQTQAVTVNGSFGPAAHTVTLLFANGAKRGDASNGTNLYVDSVMYDGLSIPGATTEFVNRGNESLQTTVIQPDTFALNLAEDAWQGDAQASISIDGTPMGTSTITAANGSTPQPLSFSGSFGGPNIPHVVTVNFLNDSYAGPGQDRNLYVQGITVDGATINGNAALMRGGPVNFFYIPPAAAPGAAWIPGTS